jgi:hypothetical protein
MARTADPEFGETLHMVKISKELANALDGEVSRFKEANPGVSMSRSIMARMHLMQHFKLLMVATKANTKAK